MSSSEGYAQGKELWELKLADTQPGPAVPTGYSKLRGESGWATKAR